VRPVCKGDMLEFKYNAAAFYPSIKKIAIDLPFSSHNAVEDGEKYFLVENDLKEFFTNLNNNTVVYKTAVFNIFGSGIYSNLVWPYKSDKLTINSNEVLYTNGILRGNITFTVISPAKNSSAVDSNLVKIVEFVITPQSTKVNITT